MYRPYGRIITEQQASPVKPCGGTGSQDACFSKGRIFQQRVSNTRLTTGLGMLGVVYHSIVRDVHKQHNNVFAAIAINMMQIFLLVAVFYVMFSTLSLCGSAIPGDFLLFCSVWIFLYYHAYQGPRRCSWIRRASQRHDSARPVEHVGRHPVTCLVMPLDPDAVAVDCSLWLSCGVPTGGP